MSSDSDSHTIREESLAPHSASLEPSDQQMLSNHLPDSPQADQSQDVEMEELDSQSSDRPLSEESSTEPGFDSQDQSMEQHVIPQGSHALGTCNCFDPVSPIEYESEIEPPAQPFPEENMILFRDEASPGFLEDLSDATSRTSDWMPSGPLRNIPELGPHYVRGPPKSDGRESTPILADPRLLSHELHWKYMCGEVDALGNPRTPTPPPSHIVSRYVTPNPFSSDESTSSAEEERSIRDLLIPADRLNRSISATSSEEEERSIRDLLIPADHFLNRSGSADTESTLEYAPAIEFDSDDQDQSGESRQPTPGPGWSDGISHEERADVNPDGEPMEEALPSSQEKSISSTEEKPDLNPHEETMEEQHPNSQEQSRCSNEAKPDIDPNYEYEPVEEEFPASREQSRSSNEQKPDIDADYEYEAVEGEFPASQEQSRSSNEEKPHIDPEYEYEPMEEEFPASQEQSRSSDEQKPDIDPDYEYEAVEGEFSASQEQSRSSNEVKPDVYPEYEAMEEEYLAPREQSRFPSYEEDEKVETQISDAFRSSLTPLSSDRKELPSNSGPRRVSSQGEDEKTEIQIFDSFGSPLTPISSDENELTATSNPGNLQRYARILERQPTPGPSNQPNPNSDNPYSLTPKTLRLWRLGLVDARGRTPQSPPSVPRRDEINDSTRSLPASKPKGKKRKNQANDSTLPAKKKTKTKSVKKSKPAKKIETPQAQPTIGSQNISPPAIPPTSPETQDQPTTVSREVAQPASTQTLPEPQDQPARVSPTRSPPAIPPTPPKPQSQLEPSESQTQMHIESQTQRPGRALRPRRVDGKATTNLRSRGFEGGIDSRQNKKKKGGKKLKTEIKEEDQQVETQTGVESSSSRNLIASENQAVVEDIQPDAATQPEVQVTEPRRPRRLILRLRSPSEPAKRI